MYDDKLIKRNLNMCKLLWKLKSCQSFHRLFSNCWQNIDQIIDLLAIVDKISTKLSTFWHIIDFLSKQIDYRPMVDIIDLPGYPVFLCENITLVKLSSSEASESEDDESIASGCLIFANSGKQPSSHRARVIIFTGVLYHGWRDTCSAFINKILLRGFKANNFSRVGKALIHSVLVFRHSKQKKPDFATFP